MHLKTLLWGLVLLFCANSSLAATIHAKADRNPVRLDESFHLIFTATNTPDDDPDFSPLSRDFEIRNQSTSSQMSWVNGQSSQQTQWTLTLMAKHAGDLTIPAIAFGKDRSQPLDLRVETSGSSNATAPSDNSELFIEVEVEPKKPYVQAQVLYTVRILRQVGLSNARMEEPKLDNAMVVRLAEDSQYTTQRNGQAYDAIERRFAIFPQKSGHMTLPAPVLDAEVLVSRQSMFNRFFLQQGGDAVRVRGKAVELEVRPIPAQFTGKHWLPVKELTLSETWSKRAIDGEPPPVTAGEPLTRTLRLEATASTVGNLPELPQVSVADLQAYPDQPALNEERNSNGLSASREEKIALMPAQAGNYTLPEIAIPWWNTETDREEIAHIPAHTLAVNAGAAATQQPVPPPVATAPDVITEKSAPALSNTTPAEPSYLWIGLTVFCALGWLITALVWWYTRRPATEKSLGSAIAETSERTLRRQLREACLASDAPAVRLALLAWAKARWPENPPKHLGQVSQLAGLAVANEIECLNRASYASETSPWNGADLWQALSKLPKTSSADSITGELEPLYRSG